MNTGAISRFLDVEVDWHAMELRRDGVAVAVKPRAFLLLEFLFKNRDRVVSKEELFETLWQGRLVSDSAMTTAVNELRRALGDTGKDHRIIRTYYGQGLRFIPDMEVGDEPATVLPQGDVAAIAAESPASDAHPDPNSKITVGLAVLAFDNLSADPNLGLLREVIAEDLITALSKFSQLSVVSRTSSFAISQQGIPLKEIASTLNVDYIVEGSLREIDGIARMTVQLIDAAHDKHVWASQFDWTTNASSQEQIDMIGVITGQVIDQVTRYEGQLARSVTESDLSAWQCYYRGITAKNTKKRSQD